MWQFIWLSGMLISGRKKKAKPATGAIFGQQKSYCLKYTHKSRGWPFSGLGGMDQEYCSRTCMLLCGEWMGFALEAPPPLCWLKANCVLFVLGPYRGAGRRTALHPLAALRSEESARLPQTSSWPSEFQRSVLERCLFRTWGPFILHLSHFHYLNDCLTRKRILLQQSKLHSRYYLFFVV